MAGYLTPGEFRSAPTGADTTALVFGGSQQAQDAELARAIARASRAMDNYCGSPPNDRQPYFAAAVRTQTGRAYGPVSPNPWVHLRPGPFPLVSLVSLQYGPTAAQLTTVSDLTGVWIEEEAFVVPLLTYIWPVVRYTYVSGYPNTTITSALSAAGTTVVVASSVGFVVNQVVTIADGAGSEDVVVSAIPTATSLTLAAPGVVNAHGVGVAIHAMPEDIKQAAILMTAALLRSRGNDTMVMGQTLAPAHKPGMDAAAATNMNLARDLLQPYRRLLGVAG